MAPAGIYIPKKSSAAASAAALDDSGLKGPGKNLLAVMKEGRPPRRHSMSADPAHLARIVAVAAAAQEEKAAKEKAAKGQRSSSPLFRRRPSLLPRSPYSLTDCGGGDPAAPPVVGGPRLLEIGVEIPNCKPTFEQVCKNPIPPPFVGAVLTAEYVRMIGTRHSAVLKTSYPSFFEKKG